MTQQVDPLERAAQLLHHQGAKGFEDLDALMKQTSDDWARCLAGMSERQAAHQPEPGEHIPTPVSGEGPKWCAKEVVGHFLVTERSLNNTVAGFAGVAPPPDMGPSIRAMGAQSPEHEALPLDSLGQKLSEFFAETATLIGALEGSANLDATFPHPVFGQLNMKEWLAFHRLHAMDHIQQIERIKADAGYPKA
jgi:hypothetical protein